MAQFVFRFYQKYGEIPGPTVIKDNFPDWKFQSEPNNVDYWIDKLYEHRAQILQTEFVEAFLKKRQEGASVEELNKLIVKASTLALTECTRSKDLNLKDTDQEKLSYQEKKESGGIWGIRLGMSRFDSQTGGVKGGELGVIMGPPKNMKTWLLLYNAWVAWLDGKRVLLISKEMSAEQMRERLAFFDAKFPYNLFKKAQLGKNLEEEYFRKLELRKQRQDFIISADDGDMDNGGGVSLVQAKIDSYHPDIVFVDGAYLMTDDRGSTGWEATKNVFRDLKRLARRKNLPIVVTTQPQRLKEKDNSPLRRKLTTEDVGNSYTISQDADFMLGVKRVARDVLLCYIIAIREGDICDWQMRIDLEEGQCYEVDSAERISEEDYVDPMLDDEVSTLRFGDD